MVYNWLLCRLLWTALHHAVGHSAMPPHTSQQGALYHTKSTDVTQSSGIELVWV